MRSHGAKAVVWRPVPGLGTPHKYQLIGEGIRRNFIAASATPQEAGSTVRSPTGRARVGDAWTCVYRSAANTRYYAVSQLIEISAKCQFVAGASHNRALRIISESPHHLPHHPTGGSGCINCFGKAAESSPGFPVPASFR